MALVNGRTGWSGTKALATVHFDNGAELEAYFESENLQPALKEGGRIWFTPIRSTTFSPAIRVS